MDTTPNRRAQRLPSERPQIASEARRVLLAPWQTGVARAVFRQCQTRPDAPQVRVQNA